MRTAVYALKGTMAADSALALALVEEFVSGLVDSKAKEATKAVKDGEFTILQLVEALGLSLTSSQPHTRARGVQLLSEVLHECSNSLTEKEVEVLKTFYENRLKDHYVVTPPVLQGLKSLTKCTVLPPGSAVSMLRSLFQDVHVQSLMLAERACVYNMLINLMETREAELKSLGPDFVFGFVQSMDGERDPRNLLLSFQVASNIVHRGYDLGKFAEELFEVTSCYFPIDFSPPPNDPHGITKEELILALRSILTGTPVFAEFLLPLIIEKVDSDVQSSKLDSLQTLAACVSRYDYKDVAKFLEGLWTSIRREVFQTSSEKLEAAALSALQALTSCVSRCVQSSDSEDSLSCFLDLLIKDCKHHLSEPDLKLVWPSAKLLQAACSASIRASHIITAVVIPNLIEQYNSRTQCSQRRTLLEVLQKFIQSVKSLGSTEAEDNALFPYRSSLCGVVFSALTETNDSLQILATSALASLAQQTGLLEESDIELAVDHLTKLLLTDEDERVCRAVVDCAGTLAAEHPAQFISRMIPRLKMETFAVPLDADVPEASQRPSHQSLRGRCVAALASVSRGPSVVQQSTPVLLELISAAHTGSVQFTVEDVVLACHGLQRIADQVQVSEETEETGRCFHHLIIPRLLSLALQAALQAADVPRPSPLLEESVLTAMVPVISSSCSRLQPKFAEETASKAVSLFLNGDVSFLPDNSFPSQIQLLKGDCWRQSQMVCLLMGCVCAAPRAVEVPHQDELLSALEELSLSSSHTLSYTSAAKCYAGLVNKRTPGEALDSLVQRTVKRVCSELDNPKSGVRSQAFTLMIWVAKALLLRYHPLSATLTDKLFSLLDDPDLGSVAADGFSLLMSDSSDVLNRALHADVRIMYRQRFFTDNSSKLVQGFHAATERKSNYLKALSNIVNKLPKQVQTTELPALLSLLLEGLSCPDLTVQMSTLSCLQPVLVQPPPALLQQLEALVSRLLALTSSPAMDVRMGSLRCIQALSHFPSHEILPFRGRVLRALSKPLDDRKRKVRSEAVQARGEWFLLGSPGGR